MSKKVLHFKLSSDFFENNGISQGFIDAGYEVLDFPFKKYRYEFGIEATRDKFVRLAKFYSPDIIFMQIQDSDLLDYETVKSLSSYGFTINYTFDCRIQDEMKWMYDLAPYCGFTFFSSYEDVQYCLSKDIENVGLLQSSCDFKEYKKVNNKSDIDCPDIVFIGSNYVESNLRFPLAQERLQMVDYLKREFNNQFWPYGLGWNTELIHDVKREVEIYNNCKIAICQNNFDGLGYTSDRIWRAMASGAFVLTKHFPGVEGLFEVGVHLDTWHTLQELKIKILEYLLNEPKRNKIAQQGYEYVIKHHGYFNRVKSIETIISKYMGVFSKQIKPEEGKIPVIDFKSEEEYNKEKGIESDDVMCKYSHTINGQSVGSFDFHFEGKICDCQKIIYVREKCGCQEPHDEIFPRENPNFQ